MYVIKLIRYGYLNFNEKIVATTNVLLDNKELANLIDDDYRWICVYKQEEDGELNIVSDNECEYIKLFKK